MRGYTNQPRQRQGIKESRKPRKELVKELVNGRCQTLILNVLSTSSSPFLFLMNPLCGFLHQLSKSMTHNMPLCVCRCDAARCILEALTTSWRQLRVTRTLLMAFILKPLRRGKGRKWQCVLRCQPDMEILCERYA